MRIRVGLLCFSVVLVSAAVAAADEPMFVRWLVMDDPGDETIRDYWQRAEREELDAPALVDLGTFGGGRAARRREVVVVDNRT